MPYMDLSCGRSTAPNAQSSPASWIPSNCIWTSANVRFGCLTARNGLRRSVQCLTTKGRSSCSPARSASSPAGGTATTSPAITASPEHRAKRSYGSIASGAGKGDGIGTAFSPEAVYSPLPAYAELHCLSNFTFLRGASHPEELVERAHALGYRALALTDECSLAGSVRAHFAAKECGLQLIHGAELTVDQAKLVVLATDRTSYGAISSLITTGRRRSKKGSYA